MVDQEEIRLMTKLALHEKKYGKEDNKRNSYFKWDYIYINNWYTRFAVGFAIFVIMAWMIFTDIYIKEIIPIINVPLSQYFKKYIISFAIVIVIYTGLSTLVYNKKYEEMKKRQKQYEKILKKLDDYQSLKRAREENLDDDIKPDFTNPWSVNSYL